MTLIAPPESFDEWTMTTCVTPADGDGLVLDMTGCSFIRPAGLVLAACSMLHAGSLDRPVTLILGQDRSALRYAERMGLGDIAFRVGAEGDQFPVVGRHDPDNEFVELTEFDGLGTVDGVIDEICDTLLKRSEEWGVDQRRLYTAVFEIGVNVEQHADSRGVVAVQSIRGRNRVEFAIGDIGIGIPASLKRGGLEYPTTGDAIRAAVQTDASRMPEHGRGAGLPRLLDIICGDSLRGHLIVQSDTARIVYRHQLGRSPSSRASQLGYRWPGTFVFGSIVTTGGAR